MTCSGRKKIKSIISIKNEKLLNSNNNRSKPEFLAQLGYRRFQIGCVFAEHDLVKS